MAKQNKDQIEKIKEELTELENQNSAAESTETVVPVQEIKNTKSFHIDFRAVQVDINTDFESVSLESVETNRGSLSIINSLDKKGFFQKDKNYLVTITEKE